MLNSFKRQQPYHSVLLSIVGVLFFFPLWFKSSPPKFLPEDGILWKLICQALLSAPIDMRWLMIFFLLLLTVNIHQHVSHHKMFPQNNALAGLSWIVIISLFAFRFEFISVWLVLVIMMQVTSKILSLYGHQHIKSELFNIGLLYSLAVLLYSPALYFGIFIGVMLLIVRPVYVTEWLLITLGALTPYYLTASFLFLTDQHLSNLLPRLSYSGFSILLETTYFGISVLMVLLPSLIGLWHVQNHMRKLLVHSRESWSANYLFLFCGLLIQFFITPQHHTAIVFILFPLAPLCAGFFLYLKNRYITGLTFLVWVLWSLWNSFYTV